MLTVQLIIWCVFVCSLSTHIIGQRTWLSPRGVGGGFSITDKKRANTATPKRGARTRKRCACIAYDMLQTCVRRNEWIFSTHVRVCGRFLNIAHNQFSTRALRHWPPLLPKKIGPQAGRRCVMAGWHVRVFIKYIQYISGRPRARDKGVYMWACVCGYAALRINRTV